MKYFFFTCITAICFLTACNNNKKPGELPSAEQTGEKNAASTTDPKPLAKEEELLQLSPYTEDQMKALLPQQLEGANLSDPSSGKATGTAYAKGTYQLNDSTIIELSLFDCGGDAGTGFYKFQFLSMLNVKPEGDDEEVKTIDFKGDKAIEHYDNNSYRSTFTYLNDRFLVTLESENVDIKGLKKIAVGLKLSRN